MPYNSFTFEITANNQAEGTLVVEGGNLVSAMMQTEAVGAGNAEFYGQILLFSTDTPTPVPIALLASGYFGASVSIGWTGRIPMEPTYGVLARIFSESGQPVRCTVCTEETP